MTTKITKPKALSGKKPHIAEGVVHKVPADLRKALTSDSKALAAWDDITPLARNEFICWIEDAKKNETREKRIRIACENLAGGKRRPCCWPGCTHR
jgi:uncharacterized protein YdeI (YjbR/CyaY-like superfamily)